MQIEFRCGCTAGMKAADTGKIPPRCTAHDAPIVRVLKAKPPIFSGACVGPCAVNKPVEPYAGLIVETPLRLKPQTKDQDHV